MIKEINLESGQSLPQNTYAESVDIIRKGYLLEEWRPVIKYKITGEKEEFPKYEINRDGLVRNLKGEIKKCSLNLAGYLKVSLRRETKKSIPIPIHTLIASTFIGPRPKGYHIDHIDRNKLNNSISNLRYVTPKMNTENRDKNNLGRKFKVIFEKFKNGQLLETIKSDLTINCDIKNYSWIKYTDSAYSFIKSNNVELDSLNWIKLEETSKNIFISELGIIKIVNKSYPFYTLGNISFGYYKINFNKEAYLVHRLVAKYFLNDGKALDNGSIIDHLDTNKLNNQITNLRICNSQMENMNNINTIIHLSRPIKCLDLEGNWIYFIGIKGAATYLSKATSTIRRWIKENSNKIFCEKYKSIQYWSKEDFNLYNNGLIQVKDYEAKDSIEFIKQRHKEIITGIVGKRVDGKLEYFSSELHLASYLNVSQFTVVNWMNNKTNLNKRIKESYESFNFWNEEDWEMYDKGKIQISPITDIVSDIKRRNNFSTPVKYLIKENILYFSDMNNLCIFTGLKQRTAYRRLENGSIEHWNREDWIKFDRGEITLTQ